MLQFIKNLFNRKRYFILFFKAEGQFGQGLSEGSTVMQSEKLYPSFKEMITYIRNSNKSFTGIILTNIIELSRKDFERYNA
jgi:hypothetical protein